MSRSSKLLIGLTVLLTILSVGSAFYRSVVLQDFEVTGVYIELYDDSTSYVYFVYDNEEYELELEVSDYDRMLTAVSGELGSIRLDPAFVDKFEVAYDEATEFISSSE